MTGNYLEVEKLYGLDSTLDDNGSYGEIEEVENDENDTSCCIMLDDDLQCGHIFFNESTRVLKFICTYCREIFENINYFCIHLSEHIDPKTKNEKEEEVEVELKELETSAQQSEDKNKMTAVHNNYKAKESLTTSLENNCSRVDDDAFEDFDVLDDAEENATEIRDAIIAYDDIEDIEDNSLASDLTKNYVECGDSIEDADNDIIIDAADDEIIFKNLSLGIDQNDAEVLKKPLCFERCFVDCLSTDSTLDISTIQQEIEDIVDISTTAAVKDNELPKKRRVTTVKVIPAKNIINELYKQIKCEKEKRSKITSSSTFLDNTMLANNKNNEYQNVDGTQPGVMRKIIGETVITLIPDVSTSTAETTNATTSTTVEKDFISSPKRVLQELKINDRTCPACGQEFRNAFSLALHKRAHYLESKSTVKLAHKCFDCNQLFNHISKLKEHVQKTHFPEGFICQICSKTMASMALLELHMRKVHLRRPFYCSICTKTFSNHEIYESHLIEHQSGDDCESRIDTKYRCNVCGRKYRSEHMLILHMKRHKERVAQSCVVCGKITLRIAQHMKTHTPRPKRVLCCTACGKLFNHASGLSKHFKVMHKLPRPPAKPKNEFTSSRNRRRKRKSDIIEKEMIKTTNDIEIDEKEERVIVELIENTTYTPFLTDNYMDATTPPIAREETIRAINSIVNDS